MERLMRNGNDSSGISRRCFARIAGSLAIVPSLSGKMMDSIETPARTPSMTDVDGILVGHYTFRERPTGCTVITTEESFTAGVDVRGGAPGTRETDLLRSENTVDIVNAIFLAGGSAFGLDVATGVTRYLEEQGRGFLARSVRIPIVCGAILIDLNLGDPKIRPDARAGYEATRAASTAPVSEGNVGAGAGGTVGKMLGHVRGMKGGLGSWSIALPDGLKVGAVVAVNCAGDVVDPATGKIVAGARREDGSGFAGIMDHLRRGAHQGSPLRENTVIGAVATNARLTKTQCNKVAQMAQDALARCIYPSHTPWDGDTVFAIATGRWALPSGSPDTGLIGALAADVLARAILRGVEQAQSWGPYPAVRDLPK
jgi:L-aminopeptidase/D-esterase-like protein